MGRDDLGSEAGPTRRESHCAAAAVCQLDLGENPRLIADFSDEPGVPATDADINAAMTRQQFFRCLECPIVFSRSFCRARFACRKRWRSITSVADLEFAPKPSRSPAPTTQRTATREPTIPTVTIAGL